MIALPYSLFDIVLVVLICLVGFVCILYFFAHPCFVLLTHFFLGSCSGFLAPVSPLFCTLWTTRSDSVSDERFPCILASVDDMTVSFSLTGLICSSTGTSVYHAASVETKVPVIIKAYEQQPQRLLAIYERLKGTSGVVQLLSHFRSTDGRYCLVFEKAPGENGVLPSAYGRFFAPYFEQLMAAVLRIHELGVVHTDINPRNVLFDESTQRVTLIDFDLGFFQDRFCPDPLEEYRKKNVYRTPFNSAPDLVGGTTRHPNASHDDWAVGIMYLMSVLECVGNLLLAYPDKTPL